MIFDQDKLRTARAPSAANETRFHFLNNSAVKPFDEVRNLLDQWLTQVPSEHRYDLEQRFRSNNDLQFDSAFWELYLHEGYRRSGASIRIHPTIPDSPKHPDFLIEWEDQRFYLEAVSVGIATADVKEQERLDRLEDELEKIEPTLFLVWMEWTTIGEDVAVGPLRAKLERWLEGLDPEEAERRLRVHAPYELTYEDSGWKVSFKALPLKEGVSGGRFVAVRGESRANMVDNVTGITRVLQGKQGRYGKSLDLPLVIAVVSNTMPDTRLYEAATALYGLAAQYPISGPTDPTALLEPGFWLDRQGWRRGHAPQVLFGADINPFTITRQRPSVWDTLDSSITKPDQPRWVARVDLIQNGPVLLASDSLAKHFDLPDDWCAKAHFDI